MFQNLSSNSERRLDGEALSRLDDEGGSPAPPLSGFSRTKPLIISSIPDTPHIPFAIHYCADCKRVRSPWTQVTNRSRAIGEQSEEGDIKCFPPGAEFGNVYSWDQEVAHGL
jgi:hypothetical protein